MNLYVNFLKILLYKDVQDLYIQEFEQAKIEYNNKQTREDRKIKNYFKHISQDKQKDLACEIIIELGDMDFWNDKDEYYKKGMVQVYKEQVQDLMKIVPEFKVANTIVHFDEISPHMHIFGVPIKEDYKRGMRKQPAKSKVFTKELLQRIQDEMRNCCIKSYNKIYSENSLLKQTKKFDDKSNNVNQILDNLKSSKLNKNNIIISNEDVQKLKNYTEDIKEYY